MPELDQLENLGGSHAGWRFLRQRWVADIDAQLDEWDALDRDRCLHDDDRTSIGEAMRVWRPGQGEGRAAERHELAPDFHVAAYSGALSQDIRFTQQGDGLITVRFVLEGEIEWHSSTFGAARLAGPHIAILSQPSGALLETRVPAHVHQNVIGLTCSAAVFRELFADDLDSAQDVGIAGNRPAILPLPPKGEALLRSLWGNDYNGRLRSLYVKSKILELACIVSDMARTILPPHGLMLTAREEAQLEEARQLLEESCCHPPQIARIGRMVGLNQTKLMRGFKAKFGETIGDFCRRRRMELGMELLERGLPVTSVAGMVGYEHHSSFTAAFRNHFGFPPKLATRGARLHA